MAKKVLDAKAKAKKQKKIAIVGSVLFVALLAYQVPKTMKMMNAKPVTAADIASTTTTTAAPTPVPGTPTPATPGVAVPGAVAPAGTGADQFVVNADLSPAPLNGQLASLTQFTSKDPFRQQAGVTGGASTPATPAPPSANPPSSGGTFTPGSGTTSGTTSPGPAPTIATISVNGVEMAVPVKTDFPADSPFFTLVSMTTTTIKIGIAGGSLATGGQTVTLRKGKPLTLMNTADGTRYVLVFVSVGDTTTPSSSIPSTGTSTPATPPTTPTTGTSTTTGR